MILAYASIMFVLKKGAQRIVDAPRPMQSTEPTTTAAKTTRANIRKNPLRRARRNTLKTLVTVFITFLVCWAPNQIIFFLFNLGWPLDFSSVIYIISVCLVAVNSCINPIIYGIKYKRFRQGARKLLGFSVEEDLIYITAL